MKEENRNQGESPVLCVDCDGTLVKTDLLYESFVLLIKQNILFLFLVPFWLLRGKAVLKREIASRVTLAPELLPYNTELLDLLISRRQVGTKLVLATASDASLAQGIASHLGIFDEVCASDGVVSLSGDRKGALLVSKFGRRQFGYVGNDRVDIPIWREAAESILVSTSPSHRRALSKSITFDTVLDGAPNPLKVLPRTLRVHQWVKNLLVFVPMIMAHRLADATALGDAIVAFIAFSLLASSVYVLNDLIDLDSDRAHPRKRFRPLAQGSFPIQGAFFLVPVLILGSLAVASLLPLSFLGVLGLYFCLTVAYSFYLKQVVLLDIIVLALLYGIRIFAGGVATTVPVSQWLLAFSLFFFFSLACVKRFSEVLSLRKRGVEAAKGRGYLATDLEQVAVLGASSGYLSVLVLALYISSKEVGPLYSHSEILWFMCPVLMYWISRVWLLAHRGEVNEDPIVFALKDRTSYIVGALAALIILCAV